MSVSTFGEDNLALIIRTRSASVRFQNAYAPTAVAVAMYPLLVTRLLRVFQPSSGNRLRSFFDRMISRISSGDVPAVARSRILDWMTFIAKLPLFRTEKALMRSP